MPAISCELPSFRLLKLFHEGAKYSCIYTVCVIYLNKWVNLLNMKTGKLSLGLAKEGYWALSVPYVPAFVCKKSVPFY
jgi:hypothetical protein